MSNRPVILVASPDRGIQRLLQRTFTSTGYTVVSADNGTSAIARIRQAEPDLILLSTELGEVGGTELVQQARASSAAPIIVLFYPNGSSTVRKLLDCGADDCLEQPFLVQELASRVKRLLLRAGIWLHPHSVTTAAGVIAIDPLARTARLGERPLELTGREFDLLLVLLTAGGAPVRHEEALQRIWGKSYRNTRQTLRRVVGSLRDKLEGAGRSRGVLINIRGLGYRLVISAGASASPTNGSAP